MSVGGVDGWLVCGIDASALRTGYCIMLGDMIVDCDTIHTSSLDRLKDRSAAWRHISLRLRNAEHLFKMDVRIIAIEDVFLGPNKKGSLEAARVTGHYEAWAYHAYPYALIERIGASSWRKALNLSSVGKEAPYAYATELLNDPIEKISQDTADAICIASSLLTIHRDDM